jgi:hypothetical protein
MTQTLLSLRITLIVGAFLFEGPAIDDPKEHEKVIRDSTTNKKAKVHIVFTETVKSKDQKNWENGYNAKVELFVDGKSTKTAKASTLPNSRPPAAKPAWWEYSLVQATCSFSGKLKDRYYTWDWSKRVKTASPEKRCLRLAAKVPTVNISTERLNMLTRGQLVDYLVGTLDKTKYQYATDILVHSGFGEDSRGSAGCLTINPSEAKEFFDAVEKALGKDGKGTLEVNRGLEDETKKQSYCY